LVGNCNRIYPTELSILNGKVGVNNSNSRGMLHLGNVEVANSAPSIVFGKNNCSSGFRNAYVGYNLDYFFVIGDYGNTNSGSNTKTTTSNNLFCTSIIFGY
jgi:hypothetical protein